VLALANITKDTKSVRGQIEIKNGEPTGILIDNPMELVLALFRSQVEKHKLPRY
jgi:predicted amidohydrolase YtcJ